MDRRGVVAVVGLVAAASGVVGTTCHDAGLSGSLAYFQTLRLSSACGKAGPWGASATPVDFLSVLKDNLPAACLVASCRTDFDTSATNFQNVACEEAQVLGSAMSGVRSFCQTLAPDTNSPRCTDADTVDLGPLTAQCYGLVPGSVQLLDVVQPTNLTMYPTAICNTSCVSSMLTRINSLATCQTPWQGMGGAPVSLKAYYKATVNAMCSLDLCWSYNWWNGQSTSFLCTWQPPNNVTGSCAASLGAIYGTPSSVACATDVFNGVPPFLLQASALSSEYFNIAPRMAASPSCASDMAKILKKLPPAAACLPSPVSFAINTFQLVVATTNSTAAALCTSSETNVLMNKLNHAAVMECAALSDDIVTWWDVYVPDQLTALVVVAKSPVCLDAAIAYANTFPACEWIDATKNEIATGTTASVRFTQFLYAAQRAANPPPLPTPSRTLSPSSCFQAQNVAKFSFFEYVTLSAACVKAGPWNASAKPVDFLGSLSEFIPLACSQSACRNDIDTSATNWQSISCDEAQAYGSGLRNVHNLCKALLVTQTPTRRCSDADSTDLGVMSSQCFGLLPTAVTMADLLFPSSVASYATSLCNQTCLTSVLNRIDTLSECLFDWPSIGGTPLAPKAYYKAHVNAMCGLDICQSYNYYYYGQSATTYVCPWTAPSNPFTSCTAKLAALHTTAFSPACSQSLFNGSYTLVIQTAVAHDYVFLARALAKHPSCVLDIAAMTNKLSTLDAPCTGNLHFAFATLQTVLTSTPNATALPMCNASQVTDLAGRLDAPCPRVCSKLSPGIVSWRDVYLPAKLADLAWVATSPACLSEATSYLETLPLCEWLDPATGEQSVGMSAAARIGSFVAATQQTDVVLVTPTNASLSNLGIQIPVSSDICEMNGAAFDYYRGIPMSNKCTGPWPATATPTDFLASLTAYIPVACAQSACRNDIATAAVNLRTLACNASQAVASSLTKLGNLCANLTVVTNSSIPRCTSKDKVQLGAIPYECGGLVPSAATLLDVVVPVNLTQAYNKLHHGDPESYRHPVDVLGQVGSLGRGPVVPKAFYKSYMNAMCSMDLCTDMNYWWYYNTPPTKYLCAWAPPSSTATSCGPDIAAAYVTPFSAGCVAAMWPNEPFKAAYIVQEVTQGDYFYTIRELVSLPSCKLDIAGLVDKADALSPSCSSLSLTIQTIQTAMLTPFTPQEDLAVCTAVEIAAIRDRLASPPSIACSNALPSVKSWLDVYIPADAGDLSTLGSSPQCVSAALVFANDLPSCEWLDPSKGEAVAVGMSVFVRVTSLLLAAQVVTSTGGGPVTAAAKDTTCHLTTAQSTMYTRVVKQPLSDACIKASGGAWNTTAKPTAFLTTYKSSLPLACSLPACRADIDASATNLLYMQCREAQVLGSAMVGLRNFCRNFAVAEPPSQRCSDTDVVELGPLTAQCFNVVQAARSLVDVVVPPSLATLSTVCKDPSCVSSILTRLNSLSSCHSDWPSLGMAPVSAKHVHQTYITSFCAAADSPAADNFTSCSARLAAVFATPFSDACVQAQFNSSPVYILESTIFGTNYFRLSRRLLKTPACVVDVATVASRLNSLGNCSTDIAFAINTYQGVAATKYMSNPALPLCTAIDAARIDTLLNAPASTVCTFNQTVLAVQWLDVFLPRHLTDLAALATPACVADALAYATAFPTCEYADKGDAVVGVDVATQVSAYLIAAQSLLKQAQASQNDAATRAPSWLVLVLLPIMFVVS